MNIWITYLIITAILVVAELFYFRIADHFNIIDKPNQRSSHSSIVLRGGGIIFLVALIVWAIAWLSGAFKFVSPEGDCCTGLLPGGDLYWRFLLAVLIVAGVSFLDDIRSLPDSVRLVAQFAAMGLLIWELFHLFSASPIISGGWWVKVAFVVVALIVCVGASNVINFMDGINGITGGYAVASLVPLFLINEGFTPVGALNEPVSFVNSSLIVTVFLADVVFCYFNFRPKGKAKCFAGDVGSIGIAYILLFMIGCLILKTGDVTYLIFLLVYGVDGCLTICHRILLHENLGEAHRKHAYQLMANELHIGHVKVSSFYMILQLAISLGFIYLCPVLASSCGLSLVTWHWIYLASALVILAVAYILFKKKYYHLHEEYLASLK